MPLLSADEKIQHFTQGCVELPVLFFWLQLPFLGLTKSFTKMLEYVVPVEQLTGITAI